MNTYFMNTYLQGRKIPTAQDRGEHKRPIVETLHLIRKLRWIGMDREAEQLQMKMQEVAPTGSVLTLVRETD
jgi:hypothetical protein